MDTEVITWSAQEHQPFKHEPDWFWALGIVAVASAGTAIILGDILFALVILCAGVTIGIIARQEPATAMFTLDRKGFSAEGVLYQPESIRAFWITDAREESGEHLLLLDTPRFLAPDMVIPLHDVDVHAVHAWFTRHEVPEQPLRESFVLKVMEFFGI